MFIIMAKYTKEEYAAITQQSKELLQLLLKKTGVKHRDIVEDAEREFVRANLDMVTATERKRFDRLVFGL